MLALPYETVNFYGMRFRMLQLAQMNLGLLVGISILFSMLQKRRVDLIGMLQAARCLEVG